MKSLRHVLRRRQKRLSDAELVMLQHLLGQLKYAEQAHQAFSRMIQERHGEDIVRIRPDGTLVRQSGVNHTTDGQP